MTLPLGPGFFSVPQDVRRPFHPSCYFVVPRDRVVPTVKQNTEYSFGEPHLYYIECDCCFIVDLS